jgi:transposase
MSSAPAYHLFVGADIAARSITCAWARTDQPLARPLRIDQSPAGYRSLQTALAAAGVAPEQTLVVMEATSTYWIQVATALHAADYAVSVINPKQAYDFAIALLRRAKTDPLDANVLAQLGAKLTPARRTLPLALYQELQQRLACSGSLLVLRTQVRNQHHALQQEARGVVAVPPCWQLPKQRGRRSKTL